MNNMQIIGSSLFVQLSNSAYSFLLRKDGLAGIILTNKLADYINTDGNVKGVDFTYTFNKNRYKYRNGYFYYLDKKSLVTLTVKEMVKRCEILVEREVLKTEKELLVAC